MKCLSNKHQRSDGRGKTKEQKNENNRKSTNPDDSCVLLAIIEKRNGNEHMHTPYTPIIHVITY